MKTSEIPCAIQKALWQKVLFSARPKRMDLAALDPSWPRQTMAVAVYRNTPFELIAQAMPNFLAYAGLSVEWHIGEYDDSLQFSVNEADLHLIWLDFERYVGRLDSEALVEWLMERLRALRADTTAPVLVAEWSADHAQALAFNLRLREQASAIPGLRLYDWSAILAELGPDFHDRRLQSIGATSLGAAASMLTARDLGLRWFPAAIRPRLKCIAVDFDNTLYSGVLGEDGVDGVVLTPAHRALQHRLLALREDGFFLAAITKNELVDVEQLLDSRSDFPLQRKHFSAMAVSWESKVSGIARIARELRISNDAILFIDDNLGEIAEVSATFAGLHCLHAADPEVVVSALMHGPDIMAWSNSMTDRLRVDDMAALAARTQAISHSNDPSAYLASLRTRLDFAVNPREHAGRIHELSNKTNQFNLALKRMNEAEVAQWLNGPDTHIVTVQLSDRLSDSGVVAILFCRTKEKTLFVEELCISCRALGRQLEDVIIVTVLQRIVAVSGCQLVKFAHASGPRNSPARDWLARFAGTIYYEAEGYLPMALNMPSFREQTAAFPGCINWKEGSEP